MSESAARNRRRQYTRAQFHAHLTAQELRHEARSYVYTRKGA